VRFCSSIHSCRSSILDRFLIDGPRGTVLHTGDLRAEPWFLTSLSRNPFLQPYIPDAGEDLRVLIARGDQPGSLTKTLNAIYLDTACLLRGTVVPTKVMIPNIVLPGPMLMHVNDRTMRSKAS
jgi:hypothetical protein